MQRHLSLSSRKSYMHLSSFSSQFIFDNSHQGEIIAQQCLSCNYPCGYKKHQLVGRYYDGLNSRSYNRNSFSLFVISTRKKILS